MAPTTSNKTVSIRQCHSYSYPAVKKSILQIGADLGGWKSIVPSGARVLLKPNLLMAKRADQAVTTNPSIVKAVAEICRDAGAKKIVVGDSPGVGSAQRVAHKCGILEVANQLGIDVINFSASTTIATPKNFLHRHFTIANEVLNADCVINLPKVKTHPIMVLTLAVKNMFGSFVGTQKGSWHFQSGRDYRQFARLLVELAYTIKPTISIADGIVGMEGNGPTSGRPRTFGFLAGSKDPTCLDRVVTEIVGLKPEQIYTLQMAKQLGLTTALSSLTITGDCIDKFRITDLKLASHQGVEDLLWGGVLQKFARRHLTSKPFIDVQKCKLCGICQQVCPPHTIKILNHPKGERLDIDYDACIRCYCCQELCPQGAITVQDSAGVKLLKALHLG